jgi:hypothetical protein
MELAREHKICYPAVHESIGYCSRAGLLEGHYNHKLGPVVLKNEQKAVASFAGGKWAHDVHSYPFVRAANRL